MFSTAALVLPAARNGECWQFSAESLSPVIVLSYESHLTPSDAPSWCSLHLVTGWSGGKMIWSPCPIWENSWGPSECRISCRIGWGLVLMHHSPTSPSAQSNFCYSPPGVDLRCTSQWDSCMQASVSECAARGIWPATAPSSPLPSSCCLELCYDGWGSTLCHEVEGHTLSLLE